MRRDIKARHVSKQPYTSGYVKYQTKHFIEEETLPVGKYAFLCNLIKEEMFISVHKLTCAPHPIPQTVYVPSCSQEHGPQSAPSSSLFCAYNFGKSNFHVWRQKLYGTPFAEQS